MTTPFDPDHKIPIIHVKNVEPYVDLCTLPVDHKLRTTPLKEIDAECRHRDMVMWKSVKTWNIGNASFNELATGWRAFYTFRAPTTPPSEESQQLQLPLDGA